MSYLRYLCLFGSSLSPVVWRIVHVLFTLFVFVWFVCISSCLEDSSCLIYVICVCFALSSVQHMLCSSCVLYVASFSRLAIFYYPIRYLLTFIYLSFQSKFLSDIIKMHLRIILSCYKLR